AAWPATGTVTGVGSPAESLGAPTFRYCSGTTPTGTTPAGAPTSAGTYTVRGSFGGNTNYTAAYADKTITIDKAATQTTVTVADRSDERAAGQESGTGTGAGSPAETLGAPSFTYCSGTTATGATLEG